MPRITTTTKTTFDNSSDAPTKWDHAAARLISKTTAPDDLDPTPCWLWTGAKHGQGRGYGKFHLDGRTISAHKAAFLLFRGDITPGNVLGHKCNNEACANPWHLEDQTQSANLTYCIESGRHNSQKQR